VSFLLDYRTTRSMIGYWRNNVVGLSLSICLSVRLSLTLTLGIMTTFEPLCLKKNVPTLKRYSSKL